MEDDTVVEENNPYYCRLCQQTFDRSIFLVDHIKAFHTENVCVSCNKQFKVLLLLFVFLSHSLYLLSRFDHV